jgi:SAM-dependent methyltransferase
MIRTVIKNRRALRPHVIDLSGATLLNLGCGYKTCDADGVVNVDFGIIQRIAVSAVMNKFAPLFLGRSRIDKLQTVSGSKFVVYDISRGIPATDSSVRAVYHSHMLEHLDHDVAAVFMSEVHRVLSPGGIHRIAVPDLEFHVRRYLEHLESEQTPERHDDFIADLIEQSVRREAAGTGTQSQPRRFVENLFLGDARKRGETHQWMYDRCNLTYLFERTNFTDVRICSFGDSAIPNWQQYGLEVDEVGHEYKPGTLYLEARAVK